MTVRLRAHHLLCLLTYVGRGYSPAFVANMDAIAARLSEGEEILLADGPDEICAPLLLSEGEPHCRGEGAGERDGRAAADIAALLGCRVGPGVRLALNGTTVLRLRRAFAAGTLRSACIGCEWASLCTTVAKGDFAGTSVATAGVDAVASPLLLRPRLRCGP